MFLIFSSNRGSVKCPSLITLYFAKHTKHFVIAETESLLSNYLINSDENISISLGYLIIICINV